MKPCRACKLTKELTEFFKDKALKDGHANTCKNCKMRQTYAWRETNKDKYNAYMRQKNKERYPDARLERYGKDNAWFEQTLVSQGNVCALCEKPNPSKKRTLAVDHCHITGRVRGILCYGCNRLMVLVDNEELLQKALAYKKKAA